MIAEAVSFLDRESNAIRSVRIAILGCGTVGGATARLLLDSRERLRRSHGIDIALTRILVRDASKPRDGVAIGLLTTDFNDVLRDEPDVIIEALGGCHPAFDFVSRALEGGVNVVTANKTLVAHHGPRLQAIAAANGSRFGYEACVGAAVPIIAAIRQRAGDPLVSLRAVLNGTCNFILSRMRETGSPLDSIVQEAIERGFAEPDPTADISGRDSAEKLCILAREAGFCDVTIDDVQTAGIEHVTPRDLDAAREHGCVVRLVGEIAIDETNAARLRVCPMFVPQTHPLAKAKGAENVFVLEQAFAGGLTLQGEGAGPAPTSAALLGDVLGVLHAPVSRVDQPALSVRASRSPQRSFVRIARSHESANAIHRRASHVHVRRHVIEAIIERDLKLDHEAMFIALVLA